MDEEEQIDFTKLKYVLYARKSTDDPERQLRSIPDQIFECKQLAERLGLNVVKVLEETKSAKKPNQRQIFKQMLDDLKRGVYDGILSWNPDRLARNMREGGEIIDFVDDGYIKDLKFVTHPFTPNANGKMLLGMAFVLSKQYSDDLSQKVTRGNRRKFAEGQSSIPKHGYIVEEGKFYKPDGKNHELIKIAWQMRKQGISIEEIVEYLNKNDYFRTIKKTSRKVPMSKQILSDIFHDPFYYGLLLQAGKEVDLRIAYDFTPAVSQEDYNLVQDLTYRRIKPSKPHKMIFYPFRLMINCSFCNEYMRVGPSSGNTKRYLYFRCDNSECTRKKRSIRSKVILDFIYKFLKDGLNFTEDEYNKYYNNLNKLTDQKRTKIQTQIHSKQGAINQIDQDIRERALNIVSLDQKSTVRRVNEDKISESEQLKSNLTSEIAKLRTQLIDPEQGKLNIEQFLNLSKNASTIVQSANAIVKDVICREVFLNFIVDEEKVLSYQLKEPFATLIKQRQLLSGRGPGN